MGKCILKICPGDNKWWLLWFWNKIINNYPSTGGFIVSAIYFPVTTSKFVTTMPTGFRINIPNKPFLLTTRANKFLWRRVKLIFIWHIILKFKNVTSVTAVTLLHLLRPLRNRIPVDYTFHSHFIRIQFFSNLGIR